jgi:cyclic beta-1,2-glucan synthetase
VMAADVYGVEPHTGRGGWTWYTGSASWMYLLILEHFIGIRKKGNELVFHPVVPKEWKSFQVEYQHFNTHYHIHFEAADKLSGMFIVKDGQEMSGHSLTLVDDGKTHEVSIRYPIVESVGE